MSSSNDNTILLESMGLLPGGTRTAFCPDCGKYGFSISRMSDKLLYHCFKANCHFSGAIPVRGAHAAGFEERTHLPELNPYTETAQMLNDSEAAAVARKFGIGTRAVLMSMSRNRWNYLLPIFNPAGKARGVVERKPWQGLAWDLASGFYPKSKTYKAAHEPMISWYRVPRPSAPQWSDVILVEDQMSAIKLADHGYNACALLGTSLNAEAVAEIQSVSKDIKLALDADATATAFKLARKWQSAFRSCIVVVLTRDVKDMSTGEIHAKFG